jgi:hypothetical protein
VLSESVDVSRVTARKAIDQLVDQGLIVRRRGSGNYIAPRIEQPLSRLTSFSEELHQRGYTPSSRWLERAITSAVPDEQLSLGLSPGARVARLERLRLADDVVMAYEMSVLPQTVLAQREAVTGFVLRIPHQHPHGAGARFAAHPRAQCAAAAGRAAGCAGRGRRCCSSPASVTSNRARPSS